MNCQYICHFSADKAEQLKRIKRYLDNRVERSDKRIDVKHYNWGVSDRCKFGITCAKIITAEHEFNRLKFEVDELLTLYIDKKKYDDYHQILNLMRGHFPAAYREFEVQIHKNS